MADIDAPLAWRMQQDGYLMQINQLHDEKTALERRIDELCVENEKLREQCADLYAEMITYSDAPDYNASVWAPKLREVGIEVEHDRL